MKVRIAAFRNIKHKISGVSVFDFDAEAHGYVRVSEFTEVELPERPANEVALWELAIRQEQMTKLEQELEALRGVVT